VDLFVFHFVLVYFGDVKSRTQLIVLMYVYVSTSKLQTGLWDRWKIVHQCRNFGRDKLWRRKGSESGLLWTLLCRSRTINDRLLNKYTDRQLLFLMESWLYLIINC